MKSLDKLRAEYEAKYGKKKAHKYGAKKTPLVDGYSFGSQLERSVYGLLKQLERANQIKDIKIQDHVLLSAASILYIADFRYFDIAKEKMVWVEAKGFETPSWRIKRRLWSAYGSGPLVIYKGDASRPFVAEEIIPKGKK